MMDEKMAAAALAQSGQSAKYRHTRKAVHKSEVKRNIALLLDPGIFKSQIQQELFVDG